MAGVSQTNSSNTADADGVTTVFNFTFFVYSASDIKVYSVLDDVLTPITTGITKAIASSFLGGTVTFSVAPADAVGAILIRREVPNTQSTEFSDLTRYKETAIEQALNTLVLQIQQLAEDVALCLKFNETSGVTDTTLEEAVDDASLVFDGTTGRVKAGATQSEISSAQTYATAAAASASAAASSATAAAKRSIIEESGSVTFALADANTYQRYTGGGGHVWTVPAAASVDFADGDEIDGFNATAFNLTLTAAANVTINGVTAGSVTVPPYSGFSFKNITGNTWDHSGFAADSWA